MAIGRPPTGEWSLTRCQAKHRIPLLSDSATNTSCRRPPLFSFARYGQESAEILALAWAHRLQCRFSFYFQRGANSSAVFFPVRFGRVHGAALASHCVLQDRSTRSFGRGTVDQTKVDGPFTRCVERDNLMKSSASRSHQESPGCHLGRAPGIQTKN